MEQGEGVFSAIRCSEGVQRQITMMNRSARAVREPRSSATLWDQLLEYFEVRLRTEKYAVTYFFGVSEATHGKRRASELPSSESM